LIDAYTDRLTPEVTGATRVAGLRPVDRVVIRHRLLV
jgi:hypothetical protein